ncbi:MAG: hypothetical protein OEX12_01215 [Gammaproteobacteria bacterium]|nr:hypothetical protein [Gammaproteobacteria bacterium]
MGWIESSPHTDYNNNFNLGSFEDQVFYYPVFLPARTVTVTGYRIRTGSQQTTGLWIALYDANGGTHQPTDLLHAGTKRVSAPTDTFIEETLPTSIEVVGTNGAEADLFIGIRHEFQGGVNNYVFGSPTDPNGYGWEGRRNSYFPYDFTYAWPDPGNGAGFHDFVYTAVSEPDPPITTPNSFFFSEGLPLTSVGTLPFFDLVNRKGLVASADENYVYAAAGNRADEITSVRIVKRGTSDGNFGDATEVDVGSGRAVTDTGKGIHTLRLI